MKRLWTTRREHARMMLRITLVRAAGALAACLLLSGLLVSAQAAAAQSQPAGLSNVEKRDLLYMERDGQLTAEQLKALEVLRAAGKMPAPLPPVYAIRGDELQALLLREQGDGLSTEEQADVQELRRRGALPPALPAPEPEAESVQWWIGYVLFFPLGVAWLAMTALPWWLGLTLGALLVVWMWQRPRRARMKAT
jgi:hypothetical protein